MLPMLVPTYNALTGGEARGGGGARQTPAGECAAALKGPKAAAGILELTLPPRHEQLGHLPSIHRVGCDHIRPRVIC